MWNRLSRWNPLSLTAAALVGASLTRAAFTPLWGSGYTFITYCPVMMFIAAVAGWRHGLAAMLLSAVLSVILFLDTFHIDSQEATALAVFAA